MFKFRKRFLSLITFSLLSLGFKAQVINNLVVFCNEPEPFTLILNGVRQNETPSTNVRVEGLTLSKYSVKIIFASGKPKDHSTTLTFFSTGTECIFALNKHGKRKYTMDYLSEKPMPGYERKASPNNVTSASDTAVVPSNTTTAPSTPYNTSPSTPTPPINNQNNNNGVGINLPGLGNIGFGNGHVNVNGNVGGMGVNVSEPIKIKPQPMTDEQFIAFTNKVSQQTTDSAKQSTALTLLKKKHLSVAQIKDAMALFSTDQSKVEFAEKVYSFATDKENYRKLVDSITSDTSKKDLNDFIDNK